MVHLLAQINWEQAGTAAVTVILALGGQRGLEALIVAWRGRRAPSGSNGGGNGDCRYVKEQVCLVRHTEQEKLQNARHQAVVQALREVRDNVRRVHERIDELKR